MTKQNNDKLIINNTTEGYINVKGFKKHFTLIKEVGYASYRIYWKKSDTWILPAGEIRLWKNLKEDNSLLDYFDGFDLDWIVICEMQISYIMDRNNLK